LAGACRCASAADQRRPMTGTMQNDEARPESPDVSDRRRSRIGSTTDTRENRASAALHQVDRVDE
jgi:hypothetical protein